MSVFLNCFFLNVLLFLCLLNLKIFLDIFFDFNGGLLLVLGLILFLGKIFFGEIFFVGVLCFCFVCGFLFDIDFIMILIKNVLFENNVEFKVDNNLLLGLREVFKEVFKFNKCEGDKVFKKK